MQSKPRLSNPILFIIATSALLLSACEPVVKSISVGTFVDSPVEGLEYKTQSLSGKTNQYGQFQYLTGESVIFSIGNIHFPSIKAEQEVTPLSVFSVNDLNNISVINMLRLLQTLDQDANPNNGISISTKAIDAAAGLHVNFSSANFDSQVASLVKNSGSSNTVLISKEAAVQHFRGAIPYRSADIVGAWALMDLQTPQKGTLNSNDFELNFDKAIVDPDFIVSLAPLQNNPSSQTTDFTLLSKISDLSLTTEGNFRGKITEQGNIFDFAYLGASKDIVLGYQNDLTHQALSIGVKVSLKYTLQDLMGSWQGFSLQTPSHGSADPTQFAYVVEKHIIDSQGAASRTIIASSDKAAITSTDQYTFSFGDLENMPILKGNGNNYAMNASKTVMINPIFNAQNNQFSVMVKYAKNYSQDDLIGTWYGISIQTPQQNQSFGTLFDTNITQFVINEKGDATITDILLSHALDVKRFNLTIDNDGQISTSPSINGANYWSMDATKTVLLLMTLRDDNSQNLTLFIKQKSASLPPTQIIMTSPKH